jgi:hypothetical protein
MLLKESDDGIPYFRRPSPLYPDDDRTGFLFRHGQNNWGKVLIIKNG